VQEMVFYKNVSGRFWVIFIQRYLYPTYKPRCFSLTLAKLDDTGVPFSHPLCGWYPRITAWLAGSGTTGPLHWGWPSCAAATLPCDWFLLWYPVPRLIPPAHLDPLWSCLATPVVIPASHGLAAHWSCDDLLMTKSIFPLG